MAPALTIGPEDFGPAPGGSLIKPVVVGRFVPTVDMGVGLRRRARFRRRRPARGGARPCRQTLRPMCPQPHPEGPGCGDRRRRRDPGAYLAPAAVAVAPADRRPRLLVSDPRQRAAAGIAHHCEAHRPLRLVRPVRRPAECAKTSAGDRSPCTRPWATRCAGFGSTPRERAVHRGAGGEGMTTDTPAPHFEQARENVKPTGFAGSSGPEA